MRADDPGSWMWTEACALIDRAERLQRQFFQPGRFAAPAAGWEPPVDILETEREPSIIAALPGVEPQDLEITIDQDVLSIAGLRRLPATAPAAAIRRLEIPYGRFQRRIELPEARLELSRPELVNGGLFLIEATRVLGRSKLILTGQLGEVMKESAQAALTLVKSRAPELGIDLALFEKSDVHIHVPAGALPKDGPSAGVAMFLALVSLFTGRTARSDTAVTGEISLRGLVLPIGGVKEKVLAAVRSGIATVLLPARNKKDLEEVPESVRKQIRIVWLEHVDDVVAAGLSPAGERNDMDLFERKQAAAGRQAALSS